MWRWAGGEGFPGFVAEGFGCFFSQSNRKWQKLLIHVYIYIYEFKVNFFKTFSIIRCIIPRRGVNKQSMDIYSGDTMCFLNLGISAVRR